MSALSPDSIEGWPLAARIGDVIGWAPNGWRVLVADPGLEVAVAEEMVTELRSLIDDPVTHHHVKNAQQLIAAAHDAPDAVHIVSLTERLGERGWRTVDMHRSEMAREAPTLLVVGPEDVATMVTSAPNLWSWIGGAVWTYRKVSDV